MLSLAALNSDYVHLLGPEIAFSQELSLKPSFTVLYQYKKEGFLFISYVFQCTIL